MALVVLEYFKVFLSWPVVVGLIGVLCLCMFKQEVKGLMLRLASIKLPGVELSTPQVSRPDPVSPPEEAASAPPPNLQTLHLSPDDQERLRSWFAAERMATRLWEFQFLNYFLALSSQYVLNWLMSHPQDVTRNAYDAYWTQYIFNPAERQAIIDALAAHALIEANEHLLRITDKGREYARWEGRKAMGYVAPATGVVPLAMS